jgi:hypothetical protein
LACIGGGPEYQRFNRTPLYSPAALDVWAIKKLGKPVTNTSQGGVVMTRTCEPRGVLP